MKLDPVHATFSTTNNPLRRVLPALLLALAPALLLAVLSGPVTASESDGQRPALIAAKASKSLTLDLLRLNDGRVLAVGERGHILLSDDSGRNWRQVPVPTRATLTAIAGHEKTLIAAGHDSVILRSTDRGETWALLNAAPANEKPILDVIFANNGEAFAVGAYGYFARSTDQGLSWQEQEVTAFDIPDFGFPHLYRIKQLHNGALMVVGEAGFIARSDDMGATWQRLAFPYQGTLFALAENSPAAGQTPVLLVSGMRGHLLRSVDAGLNWQELASGVQSGLNDMTLDGAGRFLIGGMDGMVLRGDAGAESFQAQQRPNRKGIASVLALSDTEILLAGEDGLSTFSLTPTSNANSPQVQP